jgi:hypothetical protein
MSNGFSSTGQQSKTASNWFQKVTCRQEDRRAQAEADVLLHKSMSLATTVRPPAEPPPVDAQLDSVMTEFISPDNDSASVSTTQTFNSNDSTDSLFGLPPLCNRSISSSDSSDDDDTIDEVPPLGRRSSYIDSSDDQSEASNLFRATRFERYEVETVLSESSYDTAYDDDLSISTTESLFPNLDNL